MNERIQELAEQANCSIDRLGYGEGNLEKFAKLIVQECAKIAAINQAENMNWNISEIIKEHFGVE